MEKGKISALQMAMMMYPTIVATAILSIPSITAQFAKNDSWLSPIIGSITGFMSVSIAYKLFQLYPKQTVIQYIEQIIGRFTGKILGAVILFFYILLTGQITRAYAEFIVGSFLFNTPISVVMAMMIFLCAMIVSGGIEGLARAAQLFFPIFVFPLFFLIILILPDYHYGNIFPILGNGMIPPIKGAIVPSVWFSEFFLISFLLPFLSNKAKGMKYAIITVFVVMLTLVMTNLIVLLVLGSSTESRIYPLMLLARYISVADFFEHLESVVMAIWVVGAFIKISVFYYAVALGTAQWLKLSDFRPVVWPLGLIVVAFGFWSLPSLMELQRFNMTVLPFFGTLTQIMIPLFLLMVALVRKRKG